MSLSTYIDAGPLKLPLQGAIPLDSSPPCCRDWTFQLWAPEAHRVDLELWPRQVSHGQTESPRTTPQIIPLQKLVGLRSPANDYFVTQVPQLPTGTEYRYIIDDQPRPDPASRWQPHGVHGPSALFDPAAYDWEDADWRGIPLRDYIIYELHVGTLTNAGTFASAVAILPHLVELGITAVEIMPVAQFPGDRNWGYDGTFPYAAQSSYGGPQGLQTFVDACHQQGLAVILDVVYNHLGHEGNYLWGLAPYFSDIHNTPWGAALNWDARDCDPVREFFIENALYWLTHFHIDGLRLDAVDFIIDTSPLPLMQEMQARIEARARELGKPLYLFAESCRNDARYVLPKGQGGYGLAAQWTDDLHNSLYALLTNDRQEYYTDFGSATQLVQSYHHPFVFAGDYSHYYRRRRGTPNPPSLPPERSVVYAQNHDRVGNRRNGLRLNNRLDFASQKLAAGLMLFSPYTPLLFMGEEYGESGPFEFFTDYSDPIVIEGMLAGRQQEYAEFLASGENLPDPQSKEGFERSRLNWDLKYADRHRQLLAFYRAAIQTRKQILHTGMDYSVISFPPQDAVEPTLFGLRYTSQGVEFLVAFCLPGGETQPLQLPSPGSGNRQWICQLDSNSEEFGGVECQDSRIEGDRRSPFPQPGVRLYCAKAYLNPT